MPLLVFRGGDVKALKYQDNIPKNKTSQSPISSVRLRIFLWDGQG